MKASSPIIFHYCRPPCSPGWLSGNYRVHVFGGNGNFRSKFGERGDDQFSEPPKGLSINAATVILLLLIKVTNSSRYSLIERSIYVNLVELVLVIVNPYHCILLGQYLVQLNLSTSATPGTDKKWPL